MKSIFRSFLINLFALWASSQMIPAISITGGLKGLAVGSLAFMAANILLVPLIRILLLPLNLLTIGLFAWLSNVLALYILVSMVSNFKLLPYYFPGANFGGFIIPPLPMTTFQVAIVASFLIGAIIHFVNWLTK